MHHLISPTLNVVTCILDTYDGSDVDNIIGSDVDNILGVDYVHGSVDTD